MNLFNFLIFSKFNKKLISTKNQNNIKMGSGASCKSSFGSQPITFVDTSYNRNPVNCSAYIARNIRKVNPTMSVSNVNYHTINAMNGRGNYRHCAFR